MRSTTPQVALLLAGLFASSPAPADTVRCLVPDSSQTLVQADTVAFRAYRQGLPYQSLENRDLEFLWDPANDPTLTADIRSTLDNFARTLSRSLGSNPFGAPYSDFNLIYDYFRNPLYGDPYSSDPDDTTSVRFGFLTGTYNPSDRSHADVYLFHPSRSALGGQYPSAFISAEEDLSSGHSGQDIQHQNSLMVNGPSGANRIDVIGSGWTRPDELQNVTFDHEFRHGLPGTILGRSLGELFSAGAEAIGGNASRGARDDVPFTWSLFSYDSNNPTCDNLRAQANNYQGRSAFAAYLAYNFRGTDTTATLARKLPLLVDSRS